MNQPHAVEDDAIKERLSILEDTVNILCYNAFANRAAFKKAKQELLEAKEELSKLNDM